MCPDDCAINNAKKPRLNVITTYTDTDLVLTLKITPVYTFTAGDAKLASIDTPETTGEDKEPE